MRLTRREFLQVGAMGAAGLALLQSANRVFAFAASGARERKFLDRHDEEMLAALAPAILAGALPEEGAARAAAIDDLIQAFDRTLTGLSPAIQGEVRELLALLAFGPVRRMLAGIAGEWRDASVDQVNRFLQRWRDSRFRTLQQAYQALVRLTIACWYGNPRSWERIAYPGPPHARELGLP